MDTGDIVQIVIATIMLVGVFAAYLTAFFNWRNSPVLLATKEKHSNDLMDLLDEWKQEFMTITQPTSHYIPPLEEKYSFRIEEHILFDDLNNHIPGELNTSKQWSEFKVMQDTLDNKRIAYYKHIKAHLRQHSRMEILSYKEESKTSPIGITHQCYDWIYTNLLRYFENRDRHLKPRLTITDSSPNELREGGGNIWAWTNSRAETELVKGLIEVMLSNIESGQLGSAERDIFLEAGEVIEVHKKMQNQGAMLANRINEIKTIPILTGNCKHIERAREPIWGHQRFGRIWIASLSLFIVGLTLIILDIVLPLQTGLIVLALIFVTAGFVMQILIQ